MPLKAISGPQALWNKRNSHFSGWPARNIQDRNRIEPLCQPGFEPGFQLGADDRIFTIGSCFARNIERALVARGFDVPSSRLPEGDAEFRKFGTEVLNNFAVPSILNELEWALDPEKPFDPAVNFFEVAPGRVLDLHLTVGVRPAPIEVALARRQAIFAITRRIVDCSVVIVTLGLSEVWFDTETSTYLNYRVPHMAINGAPDRYQLHILNSEETIAYLRRIMETLKRYCRSDQRMLLTVSPVPLMATYTGRDVAIANCYSKSVLRTAAAVIEADYPNVDYYPSYESVILSDRARAWHDDQIHVTPELIELNVARMVAAYAPEAEIPVSAADIPGRLALARDAILVNAPKTAMRHLEPLRDYLHLNGDLAELYANTCLTLGRIDEARAAMAHVPRSGDDWNRDLFEATILFRTGEDEQAIQLLLQVVEREPKRPVLWRRLTDAYVRLRQWDKAIATARRWSAAVPARGDAIFQLAKIFRAIGDYEQADIAYRGAMQRNPEARPFMFDYVEFLIDAGRRTEAAELADRIVPESLSEMQRIEALRLVLPMRPAPAAGASTDPFDQDRPRDMSAKSDAARAAKIAAEQARQSLAEARTTLRAGDPAAALALAERLVDGQFGLQALQLRASAYAELGRLTEAEADYRRLIAANPDNPTVLGELARILSKLGRDEDAIQLLERAAVLAPEAANWPLQLAPLLIAAGRIDEADRMIEAALAANPDDARLDRTRQRIAQLRSRKLRAGAPA